MWPNEGAEKVIIFIMFPVPCIIVSVIGFKNIIFAILAMCWGKMFLSLNCGLINVSKTNSAITLTCHFSSRQNDQEQEPDPKSLPSSSHKSAEKFHQPSRKGDDMKSQENGKKYPKQNRTHPGQSHIDIHLDGSLQLMSLPFQGQINPPDDINVWYSFLNKNDRMSIESIMQGLQAVGSDMSFPSFISLQQLQVSRSECDVTDHPSHLAATASFIIDNDTSIAFKVEQS